MQKKKKVINYNGKAFLRIKKEKKNGYYRSITSTNLEKKEVK